MFSGIVWKIVKYVWLNFEKVVVFILVSSVVFFIE